MSNTDLVPVTIIVPLAPRRAARGKGGVSSIELCLCKLSLFLASVMYDCAGRSREVTVCLIVLAIVVILDIFGWIPTTRQLRTTKAEGGQQ